MLYVSIILLAALIAVQVAKKSGIPSLMLFLSLGIISSLLGFTFDHFVFAQKFSTIALLIIIFIVLFDSRIAYEAGGDEIIPATGNTVIQKEDRILLFKGNENETNRKRM